METFSEDPKEIAHEIWDVGTFWGCTEMLRVVRGRMQHYLNSLGFHSRTSRSRIKSPLFPEPLEAKRPPASDGDLAVNGTGTTPSFLLADFPTLRKVYLIGG